MKIDVTQIEGYSEMSAEDKVKALEGYEMEDNNLKNLLSKKNSELADLTKQLRARMTEDEKAKADKAEADARAEQEKQDLIDRINQLETDKKESDFTARYVAMGFDEKTAKANAKALVEGNYDVIFGAHSAHIETIRNEVTADAMNKEHLSKGETPPAQGQKEFPAFF